jgi:hypothetical protein
MGIVVSTNGSSILGKDQGITTCHIAPHGGYDSDAEIIFAAMVPGPDANRKALINAFVVGCKEDDNWAEFDLLVFLASYSQESALVNWKNPETFTPLPVSDPPFTGNKGYEGNGLDAYIDTNFNPFSDGVKMQLNDQSYGFYCLDNTDGSITDMGSYNEGLSTFSILYAREANIAYAYMSNPDPTAALGVSTSIGMTVGVRTGLNSFSLYKDGIQLHSETTESVSFPDCNFYVLASNLMGTPSLLSLDRRISFYFTGSSSINQIKLYNRVVTYLTAIGAI